MPPRAAHRERAGTEEAVKITEQLEAGGALAGTPGAAVG
ncbi:hypothetical protein M2266_005822 [Streptomyces sp. SPB162]|nr:hypothetical protein [Streptomyces sp. SPB162]